MLRVGWLVVAPGVVRRGDELRERVRLPIPAYVIETEQERILVDAGFHPAAVEDADGHYGVKDALGPFRLEPDRSIAEQIDVGTLTMVVLKHLHFDHAGGLAGLPAGVPVVVQRREWAAGHDAAAIEMNF